MAAAALPSSSAADGALPAEPPPGWFQAHPGQDFHGHNETWWSWDQHNGEDRLDDERPAKRRRRRG